jgi:3-mercaptopyruvate sulfurtransferase SseA
MKPIILFILVAFAACNSVHSNANSPANKPTTPTPVARQTGDNVRRVTTAELADMMKQGNVLVVDVRNKEMYDRGHIAGAKLIPVNEAGDRFNELPRDKTIVAYCS